MEIFVERNILNKLVDEAAKEPSGWRCVASLYQRNNPIAFGACSLKSHPLQKRFAKNAHAIFLHAEIDAIRQALKKSSVESLQDMTLYVARAKYNKARNVGGKIVWGLAKPCSGCMRAIETFNIQRVVYTTDSDNEYEVLER
jgi:tRNA(Arg) A34 adenosine deaminase TadA